MQTPENITIYTESNPNPNSLKFVANYMLIPEGTNKDYPSVEETENAPLAKELFESFSYVKRVFYMSNFVTVTKDDSVEWYEVKAEIQHVIKEFLASGKSILNENIEQQQIEEAEEQTEDHLIAKIKGVLDEYIKPAVEMDGGAIGFESFDEGVVKVSLQGSCSGCPSSTVTLKSGIETLLKRMVPEVKEVVAEGV